MLKTTCTLLATLAITSALGTFTVPSAAAEAPPTPECNAGPDFGCFEPAVPEPGTEIPEVDINFSMRPSADNSFYIVGIKQGWFDDVGINITPEPNGFLATNDNAIPLALNNQNNIGAMYGASVIDTLGNHNTLKVIMLTDDYVGTTLWANPALGLKGVNDYLAEGLGFDEALRKTLEPVLKEGAEVATTPLNDTRPFINITFGLAGLDTPELLLVDDPENRILAKSGKVDFTIPTTASAHLEYSLDGWTRLVGQQELLENVPGGVDSPVEPLVQTVGVMANREWVDENPNATLRFASVVFRIIDAIMEDGGKEGGQMSIAAPFINSYAGMNLDERGLFEVYSVLDPLSPWDTQGKYFVDKDDARYYETAYTAYIKSMVEQERLPEGLVPDDGIWAGQIYKTLRWYQERTDALFAELDGAELSDEQQSLLAEAEKHYGWHNYLDAYRLADAISQDL